MHPEYHLKTFDKLTLVERSAFFGFCKSASTELDQPAAKNMWDNDWQSKSHTLPHILEMLDRFSGSNGQFFILFCKHQIVGCSGIYVSEFSNAIAIAGVRTWIEKDHRHRSLNRDYFLPIQKQWAVDQGMKVVLLTFNDYNKNIVKIFKRNRLGEKNDRITTRQPHHLFFNGLHEIEFPINVQFTKQWGIYEKLDPAWDFDWNAIRI